MESHTSFFPLSEEYISCILITVSNVLYRSLPVLDIFSPSCSALKSAFHQSINLIFILHVSLSITIFKSNTAVSRRGAKLNTGLRRSLLLLRVWLERSSGRLRMGHSATFPLGFTLPSPPTNHGIPSLHLQTQQTERVQLKSSIRGRILSKPTSPR